jgi:hypothetical protein
MKSLEGGYMSLCDCDGLVLSLNDAMDEMTTQFK